MAWQYNDTEYDPTVGGILPLGDYRVRIAEVKPTTAAKSGNEMWEIKLEVSGTNRYLWYYLVFLPDNPKATNQWLGSLFDSFGIQPGNMNHQTWIGKVGGCKVKHDDWGAKVHYFLSRDKVDNLPPWVEPSRSGGTTALVARSTEHLPPPPDTDEFMPIDDTEDLPFK